MLSKELATVLGGRAWPQEVFPYSFAEFLTVKGIEDHEEEISHKGIVIPCYPF